MTIFYPSELLDHLETGLSVTPHGSPVQVQPDHGPSFFRGGSASDPQLIQAAQTLVEAWQAARFRRFWEEETEFGSIPFFLPDQQYDGLVEMMPDLDPVTMPDGSEIIHTAWWECHFVGRPSEPSIERTLWRITFALEVY